MSKKLKVIVSGGGTGGHIFPAVAIANEIKKMVPDAEFLFVGAEGRMEMEKVPAAGYKIVGLWISGLQRKLTLANLSFPLSELEKTITSFLKVPFTYFPPGISPKGCQNPLPTRWQKR